MSFKDILREIGKSIKNINIAFDTDGNSKTIKASLSERQSGIGANINIISQPDTQNKVSFSLSKDTAESPNSLENSDPVVPAVYDH